MLDRDRRRKLLIISLSFSAFFLASLSVCFVLTAGDYRYLETGAPDVADMAEKDVSTGDPPEKTVIEIYSAPEPTKTLSKEEKELMALVTMAEAEGESEEGKRLVIDVILNRMDSEHFPDTVSDVIYQTRQFSSIWNGRIDRCEVREDIYRLVEEEIAERTNDEVVFFSGGEYSSFGEPMFQVGKHYFSRYLEERSED